MRGLYSTKSVTVNSGKPSFFIQGKPEENFAQWFNEDCVSRMRVGATAQSCYAHSAAKPQPKIGVYAASTLEVPQAVKRQEGLEKLTAEVA